MGERLPAEWDKSVEQWKARGFVHVSEMKRVPPEMFPALMGCLLDGNVDVRPYPSSPPADKHVCIEDLDVDFPHPWNPRLRLAQCRTFEEVVNALWEHSQHLAIIVITAKTKSYVEQARRKRVDLGDLWSAAVDALKKAIETYRQDHEKQTFEGWANKLMHQSIWRVLNKKLLLDKVREKKTQVVSLQRISTDGEEGGVVDFPDMRVATPDDSMSEADFQRFILKMCAALTPEQANVMKFFCGLEFEKNLLPHCVAAGKENAACVEETLLRRLLSQSLSKLGALSTAF